MRFLKSKKTIFLLLAAAILAVWTINLVEHEVGATLGETVEAHGSRVLGTRVDVSDATLDSGGGSLSISGLVVANPGGFSDQEMIRVDSIDIQVDPGAGVIERIGLAGVATLVEFRGARNNFEELGNRVASRTEDRRSADDAQQDEAGGPGDDEAGQDAVPDDWRIERVEIDGIRVTVQADWTSDVMEYETDELLLEDLDGGTDALMRTVTVRFLDEVLVSAAEQVDDDRIADRLMEEADELRARLAGPE